MGDGGLVSQLAEICDILFKRAGTSAQVVQLLELLSLTPPEICRQGLFHFFVRYALQARQALDEVAGVPSEGRAERRGAFVFRVAARVAPSLKNVEKPGNRVVSVEHRAFPDGLTALGLAVPWPGALRACQRVVIFVALILRVPFAPARWRAPTP